ncbi:MAG: mechanosensitive ion channel family protein [Lachnospiraceae bacterium]|jgi:small conductance mechanosensitive channel|uniref:mechanosensitive ion channel family protein n=1 Tax=Candidatus Merdisoma sp. JLR.KK011 TaxID=3114299 RepID=UPI0014335BE0|nr:mechanosensitive ion channel family protein [Lachnospiraceae bacterium]MCI9251172.1 mechanosensitive ion channel family protein [Lachnospiraceae bacterium]MCI9382843.1 mechanosensitive ion channel family protein [Lachnospiraceae bacterium]MCI9479045.1 mechanosensitive ion channel family protein [Lachnospiraceae bacterium]MCI9623172.1 mechanosensitive ion channel family protein [Lachnospiraceae bacterium]
MLENTDTPQEIEAITEEIDRFQRYIDEYLPGVVAFGLRVLMALLVFFIGSRLIKLLRRIVRRSMERAGADVGLVQFIDSLLKALLYFVLVMLIASGFGVDTTSVVALAGSAGLAAGLALQGSLANFAGGVLLLMVKPFKVGDYIIQGDLEGTVSEIQMIYTCLLTPDNRKVVIPNGKLADNSLINATAQEKRRLDIDVGISYTADLRKAKETSMELLEREERVLKEEERLTVVSELADSAVILKLRFWVKPEDYWNVKWDMTEAVKLAFDAEGIEIPFQQMDVHIREEA